METQPGNTVFTFQTSITGDHTVEAVSGDCRDTILIRKVDTPDPAYQFQKAEVVNWFDQEEYRPECFSIRDTMGELLAHPKVGAIVGRLMDQARASRGDVAQATSGNTNLQKMMAGMTLESLLKQAGSAVKPEQIRLFNAALQQIPRKSAIKG